jgi:1-acyl-sn-glycerol-3-phosphate acyltransferase
LEGREAFVGSWRNTFVGAVLMYGWGLLTVPLTVLGILAAAPFLGPRRAFFTVGPWFGRGMCWFCNLQMRVEGWADLPEAIRLARQPVIFMSNHESSLDPPFLITALPVPAVYIAKKEVKLIPFVGWAAMAAGVIFIDRGNRERAISSIQQAVDKIRGGRSVVIFPEGTRTRTGALLPFKKGGFALAMDAGVPIVPMAIVGAYEIMPPTRWRIHPGPYVVKVGEPVDPAAFDDREALMLHVRQRIEALAAEARATAA